MNKKELQKLAGIQPPPLSKRMFHIFDVIQHETLKLYWGAWIMIPISKKMHKRATHFFFCVPAPKKLTY